MIKTIFNLKTLFVFVLFAGIMSCTQDNNFADDFGYDEITLNDIGDITEELADLDFDGDLEESPQKFRGGQKCFTPNFPLTIVFPDGTTEEVADREAMRTAFKAWKESNPDVAARPTIQFPYDATMKDGTEVTFNSQEEVRAALEECMGDRHHKTRFGNCFTFVYPITLVFPDGTTQEIADQETLRETLMAWKENNPDSAVHPEIQFPVDVALTKWDKVVTVNSTEELKKLSLLCVKKRKDNKPSYGKCLNLVFPVTIEFPDGTTEAADTKETMKLLIMEWKDSHPDSAEKPKLAFPFDVKDKDGNVVTITDLEGLKEYLKGCIGDKIKGGKGGRG